MARQNIGVGASANDGTGDTLRDTGTKINANFVELYQKLGGDSSSLSGQISVTNSGLQFEGSAADDFETALVVENPTADRTVTIPNATGQIVLRDTTDTLTNKTIAAGSNTISGLVNANLSGSAAISNANLANSTVTIGDDAISLGGTQTTITDLNLDGTSSLSGTGTISTTGSANKIRFNYAKS